MSLIAYAMSVSTRQSWPEGFSVGVCLDVMYHNVRVDTRHFFVALDEDVTKLFEKGRVGDDFVKGT